MTSVYVHIPFCKRKCPYCDFYSNEIDGIRAPEEEYIKALILNLEWWKNNFNFKEANEIYFGGGTPSLLGASFYDKVLDEILKSIGINKNAEISIEMNPENSSKDWLNKIHSAGFNRITIGIQSFRQNLLKIIGRNYDPETAVNAISECQKVFENVGIDLMFGIPGQTNKDLEEDLRLAIKMNPNHISYYNLTVEVKNGMWNGYDALSDEEILQQFRIVRKVLGTSGWKQYEISNYAKEGFECKHHLNCWNYGEYMGLGSGAVSFVIDSRKPFKARRWKVTTDIKKYLKGSLENAEDDLIDIKSAMNEFVMLGLRMNEGFSFNKFTDLFSTKFDDVFKNANEFVSEGFLVRNGDRMFLTEKGREISNQIIEKMFVF